MEIKISDEMIEKMVKEQVKEQVKARVNQFLAEEQRKNPYLLFNLCRGCIGEEVQKTITNDLILNACKEISQDNISQKIADRLAEKIAESFNGY